MEKWMSRWVTGISLPFGKEESKHQTTQLVCRRSSDCAWLALAPWPLEAWEDTRSHEGSDGQIRGATVKMASRNRQHILLCRPVQLLYPLEVRCEDDRRHHLVNPRNWSVMSNHPQLWMMSLLLGMRNPLTLWKREDNLDVLQHSRLMNAEKPVCINLRTIEFVYSKY